jgi:cystathionine beta-lyase/cystathionine gamma-synthase
VQRQNDSALRIAQFLAGHPKVARVHYPFVEGHPQRALAMDQMSGGGGVLSFEVDGSGDDTRRVVESLNLFTLAPSLGGVDSLVTIPVYTSHAMITAEHRLAMGVSDQLVRLSVGIESVDDLIADLERALAVTNSVSQPAEVVSR